MDNTLTWSDFEKVEMRIGTTMEVHDFPEARKPAYQLLIDFGSEIGMISFTRSVFLPLPPYSVS